MIYVKEDTVSELYLRLGDGEELAYETASGEVLRLKATPATYGECPNCALHCHRCGMLDCSQGFSEGNQIFELVSAYSNIEECLKHCKLENPNAL